MGWGSWESDTVRRGRGTHSSQRSARENDFLHRTPGAKGAGHNQNSKMIKRTRIIQVNDYCTPTMYQVYRAVCT